MVIIGILAMLFGFVAAAVVFATFIWEIGKWIYEAWFKKEPEPNGWCPILAEEVEAERRRQSGEVEIHIHIKELR